MKNSFLLIGIGLSFLVLNGCKQKVDSSALKPPVLAPFEGIDTLATNDWWNRSSNPIILMKQEKSI
jgi:hypothetical protein